MTFIEANNPFRDQDDGPDPCDECEGTGMTPSGGYTYDGQPLYSDPPCPACNGTGQKPPPVSWSEREL